MFIYSISFDYLNVMANLFLNFEPPESLEGEGLKTWRVNFIALLIKTYLTPIGKDNMTISQIKAITYIKNLEPISQCTSDLINRLNGRP